MGTHPIFESDFDCLTEKVNIRQKTRTCSAHLLPLSVTPSPTTCALCQFRTPLAIWATCHWWSGRILPRLLESPASLVMPFIRNAWRNPLVPDVAIHWFS